MRAPGASRSHSKTAARLPTGLAKQLASRVHAVQRHLAQSNSKAQELHRQWKAETATQAELEAKLKQLQEGRAKAEAEAEDKEADDARRPLLEPPAEFEAGEVEVRKNGKLGSMASKLPEAVTLRSWNRECQLAFWAQRKSFWNNKKLSLLQQACQTTIGTWSNAYKNQPK